MGNDPQPRVNLPPAETLRWMYSRLWLLREAEETIARVYGEQEMRCPVHLCVGQEAVPVGLCAALRGDDYVFGTYRGHGLYLAKGGDLKAMMAELYGKSTGVARGKSGSMQLIAPEVGFLCASALVGGTIPMAVGAALSVRLRREDRVSVAVFGDAATEEGVWHESLNFASLRKLPVILLCENNLFAVYTHLSKRQASDNIFERAAAYSIPGVRVDGNDSIEVYHAVREAVARARRGEGPSLIEARTYRWREHCGPHWDDNLGYRSADEAKAWMARCPIQRLEEDLRRTLILTTAEMADLRETVTKEVEAAVAFAKASPFPDPCELMNDVYAP